MYKELKINGERLPQFHFLEARIADNQQVCGRNGSGHFKLRKLAQKDSSTGGRTKHNRCRLNIPKNHCLDAACTGKTDSVSSWKQNVLLIKAMGRGSYQRPRENKHGFLRGYLMPQKKVKGFATGDILKAVVPSGKK